MDRLEQFSVLESLFTWEEEAVGHFKIAFLAHYQLMDDLLRNCAERFKNIGIPRVDYFIYTEYVYALYAQLSIVIECLCKSLLEENGYTEEKIRNIGHNLKKLMKEIKKINQHREQHIYLLLSNCESIIQYFDSENIFVNARYVTHKGAVSLEHINKVKELILVIDNIFNQYYKDFDIVNIVYPDSM